MKNSNKTVAKSLIIFVFILIQAIGAYYSIIIGENIKQAEINHQKVVNQYYNLLKNN